MKAAVYTKFGPPENLKIQQVPLREPQRDELLIKLYATTVEKEDPLMRKSPGLNGLLKPKRKILGMEFSGVVESIGPEVRNFGPGDAVFGNAGLSLGTYAQYLILPENGAVAAKPENLEHIQAAALTNGALTALPFLRDKGEIKPEQRVLVNGASGTVGSAAVQIAIAMGATVDGVCSSKNFDKVRNWGAQEVYDYATTDFTKLGKFYDIIFDVAGTSTYGKCRKILNPNGIYLSTLPSPGLLFFWWLTSRRTKGTKARFAATGLRKPAQKREDLTIIAKWAEEEKLRPVIDRVWNLEHISLAHEYVEQGKNGTVGINILHG